MVFVSTLFGYHQSPPIIATPLLTGTSEKQITYQSDLFGYEIQYPKEWTIHNDKGTIYLDDPLQKDSKNEPSTVFSISVYPFDPIKFNSIDQWVITYLTSNAKERSSIVKKVFSGYEARELPQDTCGKNIIILHNGIVYLLRYVDRNFTICDSNLSAIDSVVSSFKLVEQKTKEDLAKVTFAPGGNDTLNEIKESKTELVNNDPLATIEKDFGYRVNPIYTTKNQKRSYFYFYERGEEWSPGCVNLFYLDTLEKKYSESKIDFCIGSRYTEDLIKMMPIIIQEGKFDFQNLYIANLETEKEVLAYKKKDPSESLTARCTEFGNFGNVLFLHDIEYLNNTRISIGVYKNVGQDTGKCTDNTKANYEKIRDDIIDLDKI